MIKGIHIENQIKYIKEETTFDFSQVDNIEFVLSKSEGYQIIKKSRNYSVSYHHQHDIFAALGYIFSHLNEDSYTVKRKRTIKELGYMIDCARNAVPKISTLKQQVLNLALMGYTYIGLYLEDVFEIEGEPKFGSMRGRYTRAEITDLLEFSKDYGIKVIPYIQTLAHLNGIFKHREYQNILDINDILLVDEPKTYEFIEKMLLTAKSMFQTNIINIGMDEAWMLGLGKYLNKHGFTNRMDIMIRHLNKVLDICRKHDIKPSMWADMFFHLKGSSYLSKDVTSFADIKDLIPSDVKLVYWDYYQVKKEDYDHKFNALKTLTDNYAYAGAAWKWVGFAPFNGFTEKAMKPAIKAAQEAHVNHFIVTSWGDNGAEASMFSVLPSLFFIAENIYDDALGNQDLFLTVLTGFNLAEWMRLDSLNKIYPSKELRAVNPSKYLLYEDILLGDTLIKLHKNYKTYYEQYKKELKELRGRTLKYGYIFNTLSRLSSVLELKSTLSIELHEAYHAKDTDALLNIYDNVLPRIIKRVNDFALTFKIQWHKENKFQGYEVQSYRLGGLISRLNDIREIIKMYLDKDIAQIEMLEERVLDLAQDDDPYLGCMYYNQFHKYITFGTY